MTTATQDSNLLLLRAIRQRWPKPDDRAAALNLSRRQLRRWERGENVPQVLQRLMELGVVAVVDPASPVESADSESAWQHAPFGRARKVDNI